FAVGNTGGVDVEGYDLEFEAVSIPLVRSGLDPRSSVEQIYRWGRQILRGQFSPVRLEWAEDLRDLRDRCARVTGGTSTTPPPLETLAASMLRGTTSNSRRCPFRWSAVDWIRAHRSSRSIVGAGKFFVDSSAPSGWSGQKTSAICATDARASRGERRRRLLR